MVELRLWFSLLKRRVVVLECFTNCSWIQTNPYFCIINLLQLVKFGKIFNKSTITIKCHGNGIQVASSLTNEREWLLSLWKPCLRSYLTQVHLRLRRIVIDGLQRRWIMKLRLQSRSHARHPLLLLLFAEALLAQLHTHTLALSSSGSSVQIRLSIRVIEGTIPSRLLRNQLPLSCLRKIGLIR